jgi:RNA polymerase sigma factor (TIGR02999 family)
MAPDRPQPPLSPGEITRLLSAWKEGDERAQDRLFPIVYDALRKRAAGQLRYERPGATLRPTDLVHETYLRLRAQNAGWKNRDHFFAVAARLMRRVIVDRARARRAQKRGRGLVVTLTEAAAATEMNVDVLEVDEALGELAAMDERLARIVELRFFAGLTLEEAARALGISESTASREWAHAKAWLFRRLAPPPRG